MSSPFRTATLLSFALLIYTTTVAQQHNNQTTQSKKTNGMQQVLIDKITIPANAKEAFVERMNINRNIIKQQPGFAGDEVFEQQDENGNVVVVTIARWQNTELLHQAREAVQAEYARFWFQPPGVLSKTEYQNRTGHLSTSGQLMKKILVFGATGGTGKEVVRQALDRGYEVSAVVRDPAAYAVVHPHLKIIAGDVLRPATFDKEMAGKDAVISCLGTTSKNPTTVYSEGIRNIISAMNSANVGRLICISAGALYVNKGMGLFVKILTKLVLQRILKNMYADMRLMEAIVAGSNTNWTIVRPPMLKNTVLTGKYRTAVNSNVIRPFSISRADLAHFMLGIVDDPKTYKAKAEISY